MITFLLRLYPARWRARYGDEFELILMDRPLRPFDVADTLLGALDAHLHLRGLGGASQHGSGFAMTPHIGGDAAFGGPATVSVAVSIRLPPAALVAPRLQPPTVSSGTA